MLCAQCRYYRNMVIWIGCASNGIDGGHNDDDEHDSQPNVAFVALN